MGEVYKARDIKPANLMLAKAGTQLLDFGLAKLKQEVDPAIPFDELPTKNSRTEEIAAWTVAADPSRARLVLKVRG